MGSQAQLKKVPIRKGCLAVKGLGKYNKLDGSSVFKKLQGSAVGVLLRAVGSYRAHCVV